jgi:hypothetical protein
MGAEASPFLGEAEVPVSGGGTKVSRRMVEIESLEVAVKNSFTLSW